MNIQQIAADLILLTNRLAKLEETLDEILFSPTIRGAQRTTVWPRPLGIRLTANEQLIEKQAKELETLNVIVRSLAHMTTDGNVGSILKDRAAPDPL